MQRFRIVIPALCVLLFFVWGCSATQSGKDAMKGVRTLYYKHVNKPAQLQFDKSAPLEPYQATLVAAAAPVDFELEELLRAMDDSDRTPDEAWSKALMKRFPWLRGVFIVDGRGRSISRVPATVSRLPDLAPLLALDAKQRPTDLRAAVMPGKDGPELYLAKPVYLQSDLRLLIVCHFDARSLLSRYGSPEKFMLVSGKSLLWSSVYKYSETPFQNADVEAMALSATDGIIGNEIGEFYWLASYFANIRIVYATPVKGSFSVNPRQMNILKDARFARTGR